MAEHIRHVIKELRFVGGRFEQAKGWLDFDILPELEAYKQLLIETAKEHWRRCNPGRKYLPKGFEENIRLGFHEIREGSCCVPIERLVEVDHDLLQEQYAEDEVDEAARIVDKTLIAIQQDNPLPEQLPTNVIPLFGNLGKTLGPEEGIEFGGREEAGVRPRFDETIRRRLLNARSECYEDLLCLVGEVRAVHLKAREEGGTFTIQTENGDSIEGNFSAIWETDITEALHEHNSVRLRIEGLGEFDPNGKLHRIVRIDQMQKCQSGEVPFDPDAPPIWEVLARIGASVPKEDWDRLPVDLSSNLDHYLYGDGRKGDS
ncbi:MAG TPA: hypothetical protein PK395_14200 [bacterium]|nr:hypothetical protein [bacterium]HQP99174.1 hypothetical protein [bacterium]